MRGRGRYKDLISHARLGCGVRRGYPLKTQKPSSSVGRPAGVPDSLRAHAGCCFGRPEGGHGTARMKTRRLTILLVAGVLAAAGLTAFTIPAGAQSRRTVNVPPGEFVAGHRRRPPGARSRTSSSGHDRRQDRPGRDPRARARSRPRPRRPRRPRPSPAPPSPAAARPRDAPTAASASTRSARRLARSPPASLQPRMRVRDEKATKLRKADGTPTPSQPRLHRRAPRPVDRARRPQLHHPQVPRAAVPPLHLPGRRHPVRHPLGGPRGDQRDRDRLRAQPERVVRRRRRLDAVHALHLEDLRHRRQQGPPQGSLQPGRRDLRRRALPQGRRLRGRRSPRDLRLQPRRLVRRLGAPARAPDRGRAGRPDRLAHRPDRGSLPRLRACALRGRPGRGRAAQARQAGRERRQRDRVGRRPPLDRHLRPQRLAGGRGQRRRDQEDRRRATSSATT